MIGNIHKSVKNQGNRTVYYLVNELEQYNITDSTTLKMKNDNMI